MLMNPLNDRSEFGRADAEEASRTWWIFLFAGVTSIVFGALILTVDWSGARGPSSAGSTRS
jgi:uncharacterized membrane protein HdeD (DUF308 family)